MFKPVRKIYQNSGNFRNHTWLRSSFDFDIDIEHPTYFQLLIISNYEKNTRIIDIED